MHDLEHAGLVGPQRTTALQHQGLGGVAHVAAPERALRRRFGLARAIHGGCIRIHAFVDGRRFRDRWTAGAIEGHGRGLAG